MAETRRTCGNCVKKHFCDLAYQKEDNTCEHWQSDLEPLKPLAANAQEGGQKVAEHMAEFLKFHGNGFGLSGGESDKLALTLGGALFLQALVDVRSAGLIKKYKITKLERVTDFEVMKEYGPVVIYVEALCEPKPVLITPTGGPELIGVKMRFGLA